MNTTNEEFLAAVALYTAEFEKFEVKGVAASAARARKALGDIGKLSKSLRAQIQETKLARAAAKTA